MIGWLLIYAAIIPEERPKPIFFISLAKPGKVYFPLKKYYLEFCYKTDNREIMEISAMTKKKKGKRMLSVNKRHLWFEWIRSC